MGADQSRQEVVHVERSQPTMVGARPDNNWTRDNITSLSESDSDSEANIRRLNQIGITLRDETIPKRFAGKPPDWSDETLPNLCSGTPRKRSDETIPKTFAGPSENRSGETIPKIFAEPPQDISDETIPKLFAGTSRKSSDKTIPKTFAEQERAISPDDVRNSPDGPNDNYLSVLFEELSDVVASKPGERFDPHPQMDKCLDPAGISSHWIIKWVDYSAKYGLGYQLSDGVFGVLFNDSTTLLLGANRENFRYIESDGKEHCHTLRRFPETLSKKITLLKYFKKFMREQLLKTVPNMALSYPVSDSMSHVPFVKTWFRTKDAIIYYLSDRTLHINFLQDHTKIMVCRRFNASVTYLNEKKEFSTYRLELVKKHGCSQQLASRLKYAKTMVELLLINSHMLKRFEHI